MSLINDALKRASQTPPPSPVPDTAPRAELRPVEYQRPSALPIILIPVVLLVVLGLAGWFLVKAWKTASHNLAESGSKLRVAAREIHDSRAGPSKPEEVSPAPQTAVPAHAETAPTNDAAAASPLRGTPANANPPAVATAPAPAATEEPIPLLPGSPFANLKLQGIFYRLNKPAVVINSKTLYPGDKIGNVKVVAINRESVLLESNGQTNVLTLP